MADRGVATARRRASDGRHRRPCLCEPLRDSARAQRPQGRAAAHLLENRLISRVPPIFMIKKPSRLVSDCKCLPVSVHCQDRHLCHNRPTSRPQPRHHHIRQRRADDGRRFSPRRMIETARDAGLCRGRRVARGATCPTPRRAAHVVKVAMRRSDRPASKPMLSSPTCRSWRMVAAPNPARRMGRHRRFQASLRSVTPPPRHCGSGKIAGRRRDNGPARFDGRPPIA
jgi:hypothetical protein